MNKYLTEPTLKIKNSTLEKWFLPNNGYYALFMDAGPKLIWNDPKTPYELTSDIGVWYPLTDYKRLNFKVDKAFLQEKWPFTTDHSIKTFIKDYNKGFVFRHACEIHGVIYNGKNIQVFQARIESVGEIVMAACNSTKSKELTKASRNLAKIAGKNGYIWAKLGYKDTLLKDLGL